MVSYRIEIIPMIKILKYTHPDVAQTWYAENAGALGTSDNLERYFNSLKRNGPDRGYYPDPTKIILVVHPKILKRGNYLAGVMDLRCAQAQII